MPRITPHLWFDTQAKEATAFYATLFPNSSVTNVTTIHNTPSGDCDIVSFRLAGQDFMAMSAGPIFKLNPSISFFVEFDNETEIEATWKKLADGGMVMMEYNTYPWAKKYGWVQDKYGMSWQLSWNDQLPVTQKITPMLMFVGGVVGKTKEAIEHYAAIFPNSSTTVMVPYAKGDNDHEGFIKHSRFMLDGQQFMAMDSSYAHKFGFNEALSFIVTCANQEEIDYYWDKLSAVPESEQCGWLKDKYGVSWQIVPKQMSEMMASGDAVAMDRVTKAFLPMKKFDVAALERAFRGE